MKKITLFFTFCAFLMANVTNAQTVVWSDDFSDTGTLANWAVADLDGDTINWGFFNPNDTSVAVGFTGIYASSASWSSGALTPDNLLYTPTMAIPSEAEVITYKMKVAASYTPDFAENFSVYVYDDASGPDLSNLIYTETLTSGSTGTAKFISADVPSTFAGKTIGFLIRHHDCTNQERLFADDFEVFYTNTLSTEDTISEKTSVYPNSVKDIITIITNKVVNSVNIVNQLGQTVKVIEEKEILNNTVDLSNLSKGFYFMSVNIEGISKSFKIIKE